MAPDPRKHSARRGKARLYLCSNCGVRHASPTGTRCQRNADEPQPTDVSQMSSVASPGSPRDTPTKRRRITWQGPQRSVNQNPMSDDESMDAFLIGLDRHANVSLPPSGTIAQSMHPVTSSPSASPVPGPSQGNANDGGKAPMTGDMFTMLCEQMTIMADTQTRERQRLEQENKMGLDGIQAALTRMSDHIESCEANRVRVPQNVLPERGTVERSIPNTRVGLPTAQSTGTQVSGSAAMEASEPVQSTSTSNTITPAILAQADDPIRTLPRHRPTATDAASILREIALIESGSKRKKGGHINKSQTSQIEADWPDLYVYRVGNTEPTYDSLSLAEFVAGYLSIMEEVTPLLPGNTPLIRHLNYLHHLMEDCFLADWEVVKMAHKQILCSIEHRRLRWEDAPMVLDTKRVALARIQQNAVANRGAQQAGQPIPPNAEVCQQYQTLACNHVSDHETEGRLMLHCSSFCLRSNGCKNLHPEVNCRKAKEANKKKKSRGQKRKKPE